MDSALFGDRTVTSGRTDIDPIIFVVNILAFGNQHK
jgi:hypothetical protein